MTGELQDIVLKIGELIKILTPPNLLYNPNFWSTIVLVITLGVLIRYTIETHKLAVQARDTNLRPIILRSGFLDNWDDLKFVVANNKIKVKILEFAIKKNIATTIKGYAIINKKKYELLFANEISKVNEEINNQQELWKYLKQRGWQSGDTMLYAIFKEEDNQDTQEANQIVITYKDIEGNSYYTIEDKNFQQESLKGNP